MNKLIEQLKKERLPVHEKCLGKGLSEREESLRSKSMLRCSRVEMPEQADIEEVAVCTTYVNPGRWWRLGICPMADHVSSANEVITTAKSRVGQQKQKKKK